jgi:cytidylate kinase
VRSRGLVVAIDGPSGAGKSTAGKALAARLGYVFLDTGAMYRAIALKALESGVNLEDGPALGALARASTIGFIRDEAVLLDGRDVTSAIRTREVATAASRASGHPELRKEMVARQRELGKEGGIVLDGRDIGTAVFPDAEIKFFVDADPHRRAIRRQLELGGSESDLPGIERELRERDRADSARKDSPLVRAEDARYLDTTSLSPEETLAAMLSAVEAVASGERRG